MASSNQGALAPTGTVRVQISFEMSVLDVLSPLELIYNDELHLASVQEQVARYRINVLPEGDAELLERIQSICHYTEAVAIPILERLARGRVEWLVERPDPEVR